MIFSFPPVGCMNPLASKSVSYCGYILAEIQLLWTSLCIDNGVVPPPSFQINMIGTNNSLILIALSHAWVDPLNARELLQNNGLVHHPKRPFSDSCLCHTHPDKRPEKQMVTAFMGSLVKTPESTIQDITSSSWEKEHFLMLRIENNFKISFIQWQHRDILF